MSHDDLAARFADLSTPLVCDAALRLGVALRHAPPGIRPVIPGTRTAGRALPARHYGSVDVFLEAMQDASTRASGRGSLLVIDNGGRLDEGCIGDLTALEARASGLAGIVVWGVHRDTRELVEIAVPVFSYGTCPMGPVRLDPREADALRSARFGDALITGDDAVFADDDGVVFAPLDAAARLCEAASAIRTRERAQADAVRAGRTLREQLRLAEYLEARGKDPAYSFRRHLKRLGGAIEE